MDTIPPSVFFTPKDQAGNEDDDCSVISEPSRGYNNNNPISTIHHNWEHLINKEHNNKDDNNDVLELLRQLAKAQEKIEGLTSKLNECYRKNDELEAENEVLMEEAITAHARNAKLMRENARLKQDVGKTDDDLNATHKKSSPFEDTRASTQKKKKMQTRNSSSSGLCCNLLQQKLHLQQHQHHHQQKEEQLQLPRKSSCNTDPTQHLSSSSLQVAVNDNNKDGGGVDDADSKDDVNNKCKEEVVPTRTWLKRANRAMKVRVAIPRAA